MNKYIIHGGRPLMGEVTISGAKNAAVAIIPAALLVDGVCRIENIPQISDVTLLFSILEELGARVRVLNRHTVEIDRRHVHSTQPSFALVRRIRASYYLLGALLGRFGKATVAMPGGCNFGVRPIDQHVKGFRAMGAGVTEGNLVQAVAKGGRLTGAAVYLDMVSVGATMNIMMAAALAEGTTTIENAAKEPHIVDLANFLNSMGADIKGAGTDSIRIRGVEKLNGGTYCIIPDQIEAGTYMAAVAAAGGRLLIRNVIPKHMDCISAKLTEMGVTVEEEDDTLLVSRSGPLQRTNVKTQPYPHGYAAPDRGGAVPGPGDQPGHRGRIRGQPLQVYGRAAPHGRTGPGRRPGGRDRRRGVSHRRAGAGLRPAGRCGPGDRGSGGPGRHRADPGAVHRAGL